MGDNVINDLKMAEINLAKVENAQSLIDDAHETLEHFRTDMKTKEDIETSLDNINNYSNYEITPGLVKETDDFINSKSDYIVKNGEALVSGTESFGLTLSPAEWKTTRALALGDLLSESYKNIKRWANHLTDIFQRRWEEIRTSIETLDKRLSALDITLFEIDPKSTKDGIITVNEVISKTLSKNGKPFTKNIPNEINNEINYIFHCLSFWSQEQIRYKNTIIRYFGNSRNQDIKIISRLTPKVFNRNGTSDDNGGMLVIKETNPLLDGISFESAVLSPKWIKENITTPEDSSTYVEGLSNTGFGVVKHPLYRVPKITMDIFTIDEIIEVKKIIEKIIEKIKLLNESSSPVNFNPDDIKDVIKTLKETNQDKNHASQYGALTADYQYNTNTFITETSIMLTLIASHLITLLVTHLECYEND